MHLNQAENQTDPARLLRRLREVLGGANIGAQEKLERIVKIVSAEMRSEVCSVYVKTKGNVLILFATEGLNPLAVQFTRLRVGEGVIGDVAQNARPLVISDIRNHPNFAYRPETGEDPFHGFLGVPIFRSGKVIGVIAVQSSMKRLYDYSEIDLLQTISMIIAELISSREFSSLDQLGSSDAVSWMSTELSGLSLNMGIAQGIAVFHQTFPLYSRKTAANIYREKRRLQRGLALMQASLKQLFSRQDLEAVGEHHEVFEVYNMLAFDRGWQHRLNQAIEKGLSAEAAVDHVLSDMKTLMTSTDDKFWGARVADFEDLSHRLQHFLGGQFQRPSTLAANDDKIILVARSMGPAELLDYDPGAVAGVILEEGHQAAHVSIVARALDIPVIARIPGLLLRIEPGDQLLMDGGAGTIIVRPGSKIISSYEAKMKRKQVLNLKVKAILDQPSLTKDGEKISLGINAGLPMDMDRLEELGADSIGLYRTEIPFMLESSLPGVEAQKKLYKEIFAKAKGKPVIFRTLDIGGDKLLPYLEMPEAENPAMGWRAIRISLDRPALFRNQIRALLQAAVGETLSIMVPMVTTAHEFKKVKKIIDLEVKWSRSRDIPIAENLRIGAMMEVPSLAYDLKALLPEIDFLSLGSNDLLQFFFAADRSNVLISNLYDPISTNFLAFLNDIIVACDRARVPLQLCGELSSSPLEAMVLLGMGLRSLSMSASSFGRIKLMVRSLNVKDFRSYLLRFIQRESPNIRNACIAYAQDHGIEI